METGFVLVEWYSCHHNHYLGDTTLHDKEMRVIDVQLNTVEHILHLTLLRSVAIDHVFVLPTNNDLSGDCDLFVMFISNRTGFWIRVIEHNGHCRFGDSSLALLVNQLLKIANTNLTQLVDS